MTHGNFLVVHCLWLCTFAGFPGGSDGKPSACNAGDLGWKDPWRRKWQPTPVLLPRKLHGLRRLVGYSPWGRKEPWLSDLHYLSFCTFTAESLGSVPGWGTKTPQAVPLNKKTQSPSELWQIWKIYLNTEVSRNSKGILKEYIETRNDNGTGLCHSMQFLFLTEYHW